MKQLGRYSKEPFEEVHFGITYLLNFIYHTTKFHNCVCANQGWWKQLCNILFFESKVTTYFNRDLLTPFHYGDIPALAKTNFGGWHCDYDMNNKPYKWEKQVLSIIRIWLFYSNRRNIRIKFEKEHVNNHQSKSYGRIRIKFLEESFNSLPVDYSESNSHPKGNHYALRYIWKVQL